MTERTRLPIERANEAITFGELASAAIVRARKRIPKHLEGVRDAEVESVHQFRVETRRLRVALTTFHGVYRGRGHRALEEGLGDLGRALAPLRDAQVFATEILTEENLSSLELPIAERLLDEVHGRIEVLAKKARRVVRSADGRDVLRAIEALRVESGELASSPAAPRATAALDRWHAAATKRAMRVRESDDASIHAFRRAIRRLRYATALVAPAYRKRDVEPFLAEVGSLRDVIGAYRDANVARATIVDLLGRKRGSPVASALVRGPRWHDVERAIERFAAIEPFFAPRDQSPRARTK